MLLVVVLVVLCDRTGGSNKSVIGHIRCKENDAVPHVRIRGARETDEDRKMYYL